MRERDSVGCLFIDHHEDGGFEGGIARRAMNIPGISMRLFHCNDGSGLWDRLQSGLQAFRDEWGMCAVMAEGVGCAAALALACQLPVEKLVLIDPASPARWPQPGDRNRRSAGVTQLERSLRRLAAFARRNLPLCVSDMLIVGHGPEGGGDAMRRAYGNPVNSRVKRLSVRDTRDKDLYTIREIAVKEAISRFLQPVEASKPLAEKSEMCIIYG